MIRFALASLLLLSAPFAAAQTIAHQNANGASANCPGSVEESDAAAASAPAANGMAPAIPTSTAPSPGNPLGEASRSASPRQATPRVRWHSFLPGMMK